MTPKPSVRVLFAYLAGFVLLSILYLDQDVSGLVRRISSKEEFTTLIRSLSENKEILVTLFSQTTESDDLCKSMRTLKHAVGSPNAPILIFHSTDISADERSLLESCTDRSVTFSFVELDFPTGFEPEPNVDYTDAKISRFWTTTVWTNPALEDYDIIMRFDHDTCFTMPDSTLPKFKNQYVNYHSHYLPGVVELNAKRLDGMYQVAESYMYENEFRPGHAALWQRIEFTHNAIQSLPNFQDSFEVVRKDFMLRDDIVAWHNVLTETAPFGYFTDGWNVDAERFLTMAMFGTKSSIDTNLVPGYMQKNLVSGKRHEKVCSGY